MAPRAFNDSEAIRSPLGQLFTYTEFQGGGSTMIFQAITKSECFSYYLKI